MTKEICSYPSSWFPVHIEDNCHFIPSKVELTCGDCARLGEDTACLGCVADDSAMEDGELCFGFIDKREEELQDILMFWKVLFICQGSNVFFRVERWN